MAQTSTRFADAGPYAADGSKTRSLMARVLRWIAEQRRISRTERALLNLSDSTLRDIGIERSDISRVARNGRSLFGNAL